MRPVGRRCGAVSDTIMDPMPHGMADAMSDSETIEKKTGALPSLAVP